MPIADSDFHALAREVHELNIRFSIAEALMKRRDEETESWRRETREAIKDLRGRINGHGGSNGKPTNTAVAAVAAAASAAVVAVYKLMGGP